MKRSSYNVSKVAAKEHTSMASPKKVTFPSTNKLGDLSAIICGDPKCGRGIIVLQEWWGLNDQIQNCGKEICKDAGMVTLVPDLYRGKVATDNETAGHYMGDLDWKGAVEDIQACVKYLNSVGCAKVGVTGFCMGGALTLAGAALVPGINAAAPFYGIPSAELCDVTKITCPLQCHFGEKDSVKGFSSPDEWKPLKVKLTAAVPKLEFHTYDTDHAFTNSSGPNYNSEATKLAFDRMFKFFDKNL